LFLSLEAVKKPVAIPIQVAMINACSIPVIDKIHTLMPLAKTDINVEKRLIDGVTIAINVAAIANSSPKSSILGINCPATIPTKVEQFHTKQNVIPALSAYK